MRLIRPSLAPAGYVDFCRRQPLDCEAGAAPGRSGDATSITGSISTVAPDMRAPAHSVTPASDWVAVQKPAVNLAAILERGAAPLATTNWAMALSRLAPAAPADTEAVTHAALARIGTALLSSTPAAQTAPTAAPPRLASANPHGLSGAPDTWERINRINRQINKAIVPRTDLQARGVEEFWSTPLAAGERFGDCEDYVLEKRRALINAGFSTQAMSIAVVSTSKGERHAVLLVQVDDSEYVLDNLSAWITPWQKTTYRWHERQIAGSPNLWAAVANPTSLPRSTPHRNAQILLANLD